MNEEIQEYLDRAVEELKRVEHLVYVSLKYTRTVDVLLNIISRMIDGYTEMWAPLLLKLKEEKKIEDIPEPPVAQANILLNNFKDKEIVDNVQLFLLLRKLHRSNPEREQEYRRHVTMRTVIDGREEIVNIDIVTQYHHMQRLFMTWLFEYFGLQPRQRVRM